MQCNSITCTSKIQNNVIKVTCHLRLKNALQLLHNSGAVGFQSQNNLKKCFSKIICITTGKSETNAASMQ